MVMLQQLEDLFVQAIPTVVMVILFYAVLNYLFFKPLLQVMAERSARTEGARREAEASQAAAREKVLAYEEALRKARAAVHAEQDAARRAILDERAAHTRHARTHAMERVQAEKETIAQEVAAARVQLETTVPVLAAEMARTLIEGRPGKDPAPVPASEAR
jgi:F0F1-type ATP synthase membrane subunit b/b'